MYLLAHTGVEPHLDSTPLWRSVPFIISFVALVGAVAYLVVTEMRGRERLRRADKKRFAEVQAEVHEERRRDRVLWGSVAVVCVLAASGLALTHEPQLHEGPGDGPPITIDVAVEPDSELEIEVIRAHETGEVHLRVANDRPTAINAQCTIAAVNASGESVLARSYESVDDNGDTTMVDAYVNSFTILPEVEVQPGITLEITEPVDSVRARCDVIPFPPGVEKDLREDGVPV
ncbi:MAG: hypothetical protein ACRDLB_02435 [Actinomycetota bacterium]